MRILEPTAGIRSCHGRWLGCVLVVSVFLYAGIACGQSLQDLFANRQTITSTSGDLEKNNQTATVEPGEPRHGGKVGGRSLWISWVAPTNGVIRFQTETSGFDTLLSAYQFTNVSGSTFAELREVARSDDSEGLGDDSEIEFAVYTGERYEIAVDGYFGAFGEVEFSWDFDPLPSPPAKVLTSPPDRSANLGETITLSVTVTNAAGSDFAWYFNGVEIPFAQSTSLVLSNMQASKVGRYKFRVNSGGGVQYFSIPTEIQINTDGSTNTLAQPKYRDTPATPLLGTNGGGSSLRVLNIVSGGGGGVQNIGVVRGYNGSQIFNTTYAVTDPAEPAHCNVVGGASYWLLYQPPTNGTITLDTIGSTYDTVMSVYTYNGALTGYQDLIQLDCSDNSFPSNNASRVVFPVVKSRQYLIAVDGVAGARGTAWLNYSLNTNQPAQAPALTGTPSPIVAPHGATVAMSAPVTGAPPLVYTWRKNGVVIPGINTSPLVLANVTTNSTASYSFAVTNDLGGPAQSSIGLTVILQPACTLSNVVGFPNALKLSFPTIAGRIYFVEDSTNLSTWSAWPAFYIGDGNPINAYVLKNGNRFFRVRVE
jgi:hypothetical protein